MTCPNPPPAVAGDAHVAASPVTVRAAGRVVDVPNKKQTMRLRKTEWMGVAVVAGSIACFGGWLQSEMTRASLARMQRDSRDSHGACGGMSAREAEMRGKGELWCGAIGSAHGEALGKT
jgi:hypothetical protein